MSNKYIVASFNHKGVSLVTTFENCTLAKNSVFTHEYICISVKLWHVTNMLFPYMTNLKNMHCLATWTRQKYFFVHYTGEQDKRHACTIQMPAQGMQQREVLKRQLTRGINTWGLYINKGGSLLLDVINIPVFLPIPPRGIRIHL